MVTNNLVYFTFSFDNKGNLQLTLTDALGSGANSNSNASVSGNVLTVKNTPGASLPMTGGPGTRLFTIAGSLLIMAAGAVLARMMLIRRRMD